MSEIQTEVSPAVAATLASATVWDNHACMPLNPDDATFLPQLERHRRSGVHVVSLNVGFDAEPWENTVRMLAHFRRWLSLHADDYQLVGTVADIDSARRAGRLGVLFDIEGGCALGDQLDMVQLYYELGVRWMLIAYNRNNSLGGGCQDEDRGLTSFGRRVLDEMARVGMVACCSHTGHRTAMEVMERSRNPIIYSHSNPEGVWRHRRNISDEAIKACAATGGVVGINGIGLLLGRNDASTETFVRHVDHVVQLVGPEHVGLALDYVFDQADLAAYMAKNPHIYPPQEYPAAPALIEPERIPLIAEALHRRGYDERALRAILGGNHLRIARQVWR